MRLKHFTATFLPLGLSRARIVVALALLPKMAKGAYLSAGKVSGERPAAVRSSSSESFSLGFKTAGTFLGCGASQLQMP
jgi:hypothetical protein